MAVDNQSLAIDYCLTTLHYADPGSKPAQPIVSHSLFACDVGQSGAFDLSAVYCTSLAQLLDALPLPVLLIDQWFCVAFVNQSCERLSINYRHMKGSRFTDLLPNLDDPTIAKTSTTKVMTLLERVFADTGSQGAETILEMGKHRIWARLHLRSVRVVSGQHIMVVTEDVTSERTHRYAFKKVEEKLRKALVTSQERVRQVTRELSETTQDLQRETPQHEETRLGIRTLEPIHVDCRELPITPSVLRPILSSATPCEWSAM